jgi:beta-galactosidase
MAQAAGISPVLAAPVGVEAIERWQEGQRVLFLLNHGDQAQKIALPQPMTDRLTDRAVVDQVNLPPQGVMILQAE